MTKKRTTRMTLLACAGVASLGLLVGASPAAAKTKTATSNQCVTVSIPYSENTNPAVAAINVTVPKFKGKIQDGTVTAINSVDTRITHTFDGDNTITLLAPGGRSVALATRRGGSGDDFGTGGACTGGVSTVFSDTAATPISTGTAPFAGSFRPESPLSNAAGGPARGTWYLVVSDQAGGDTGTLLGFSLNVTYRYKVVQKKKK
jgi:subtilisin-like proprotein convertase family protein